MKIGGKYKFVIWIISKRLESLEWKHFREILFRLLCKYIDRNLPLIFN